jgi:hypothetical protein
VKPANCCSPNPLADFIRKSLRGFKTTARKALWAAAAVLAVGLSACLIVVPLWFFSSRYKDGYAGFALLLGAGAAVFLVGRKVRAAWKEAGSFRRFALRHFRPAAKKTAGIAAAAAGLYGLALLFAKGHIAAGIAAGALYALFLGFLLSFRGDAS